MSTNSAPNDLVCCDASIVIRFITDPVAVHVHELWSGWEDNGRTIVAPSLMRFEVTNALHRLATSTGATAEDVQRFLDLALQLPIHIRDSPRMHQQALLLSQRLRLTAAYDAHYLALSEWLGCEFFTSDARLFRAVSSNLSWVRLVE